VVANFIPDSRSDNELLKACRRDPDAFCVFYRRHAEGIYHFFRRRVDEPETAHDLTAETFAEVFRSVKRFRGNGDDSGVAWLYGIARNLLRQYRRRNAVATSARSTLGVPLRGDTLVEYEEADDRVSALQDDLGAALDKLPAGQRAALELRVVQDLSYQEVAARLETSELTARMRVSRALRALSAHMKGASA